jgi:hypothetical protein
VCSEPERTRRSLDGPPVCAPRICRRAQKLDVGPDEKANLDEGLVAARLGGGEVVDLINQAIGAHSSARPLALSVLRSPVFKSGRVGAVFPVLEIPAACIDSRENVTWQFSAESKTPRPGGDMSPAGRHVQRLSTVFSLGPDGACDSGLLEVKRTVHEAAPTRADSVKRLRVRQGARQAVWALPVASVPALRPKQQSSHRNADNYEGNDQPDHARISAHVPKDSMYVLSDRSQ